MGCGGSDSVDYPAPTKTEKEIQALTLANMYKEQGLTDALLPYMLAEMGLVEAPSEAQTSQKATINNQKAAVQAEYDAWKQKKAGWDKYDTQLASLDEQQTATLAALDKKIAAAEKKGKNTTKLEAKRDAAIESYNTEKASIQSDYDALKAKGLTATSNKYEKQLKDFDTQLNKIGTSYRQQTAEERQAGLTDLEKKQQEVTNLQLDRTAAALKGELPISPALEKSLGKSESDLAEYLNRTVGPNWQASSPAQQMTNLKESNELVREEARRGEINSGTSNLLADMGFINNTATQNLNNMRGTGTTYLPVAQGWQSTLQPYQLERQNQYSAGLSNAQMSNQRDIAMMQGLTSMLGVAGGMGLEAYLSPKSAKPVSPSPGNSFAGKSFLV